eukprot:12681579-Alexandrium_andersonii.AAC.1
MSASLVGSEMCIRDSSNGRDRTTGELMGAKPAPCKLASPPGQQDAKVTCLLYTSDAADDM